MIQLESYESNNIVFGITHANTGSFTPNGFCISVTNSVTESVVTNCRTELCKELGFDYNLAQFQQQVHSDVVVHRPIFNANDLVPSDGMITTQKGVLLCVSLADCCGVLLWDLKQQVIAAIHSGWRGTHQNITGKAVTQLIHNYSCKPENLHVWLSPCASGESYKVQKDVQQYFPDFCHQISDNEFLFDNKKAIQAQLSECNIDTANIITSSACTIRNREYHSFRRDGVNSGRMSAFIAMK